MGNKALLDAIEEHTSAAIYDGGEFNKCLIGQLTHGEFGDTIRAKMPRAHILGTVSSVSEYFDVEYALVKDLWGTSTQPPYIDNYHLMLEYARNLLDPV